MDKLTALKERLELYRRFAIREELPAEVAKFPSRSDADLRRRLKALKLDIADYAIYLPERSKGRLSKSDIEHIEGIAQGKIQRELFAGAIEQELTRRGAPVEAAGDE